VRLDWKDKPGVSNLMEMHGLFTGASMEQIEAEFGTGGYGRFKEAVAEAVVAGLAPMQAAYRSLDDGEVSRLMEEGARVARERAEGFQEAVRRRVGLTA
jgi:tryptophanyl-tRNA synthetase